MNAQPKTITVASRKRDPKAVGVQKYTNSDAWNVPGGTAPTGVSATRYLRQTSPDVTKLSPLASWLFQHCPPCVAGKMPSPNHENRIRCYNGLTVAEEMRRSTPDKTTEPMIAAYDLENQQSRLDDWLFEVIEPDQTDEDYWNAEASRMLAMGTIRVEIGPNYYEMEP